MRLLVYTEQGEKSLGIALPSHVVNMTGLTLQQYPI